MFCEAGVIWGERCFPDGVEKKISISSCYLVWSRVQHWIPKPDVCSL